MFRNTHLTFCNIPVAQRKEELPNFGRIVPGRFHGIYLSLSSWEPCSPGELASAVSPTQQLQKRLQKKMRSSISVKASSSSSVAGAMEGSAKGITVALLTTLRKLIIQRILVQKTIIPCIALDVEVGCHNWHRARLHRIFTEVCSLAPVIQIYYQIAGVNAVVASGLLVGINFEGQC